MKNYCIIISFLLFSLTNVKAQKSNQLYLTSGTSLAGTGDIRGFYIGTGLQHVNKRWHVYYELSTTIHDGSNPLFFETTNGDLIDASIRYNTTGIQASSIFAYNFLKSKIHVLNAGAGPLIRYQSSSYYDAYTIVYPIASGFQYPFVIFDNTSPMRTIAIGANIQTSYQYNFYKKFSLGLRTNFQFDTNGDIFFNKGLSLGYKL